MGVLGFRDPVREGAIGLVPVDAHVAGGVVDEVVDVVAQLTGGTSPSCLVKGRTFRLIFCREIIN